MLILICLQEKNKLQFKCAGMTMIQIYASFLIGYIRPETASSSQNNAKNNYFIDGGLILEKTDGIYRITGTDRCRTVMLKDVG